MTFKLDPRWARFVFSKGFIALDGCSLTVVNADRTAGTFQVWFIPETLEVTTFGARKVGDRINVEIERSTQVIVETVERVMAERFAS
jgi:riboflavin synthase